MEEFRKCKIINMLTPLLVLEYLDVNFESEDKFQEYFLHFDRDNVHHPFLCSKLQSIGWICIV